MEKLARFAAAAVMASGLSAVSAKAGLASDAAGVWAMSNGKVTVRVSSCGNGICGTIIGLKEPISKIDGKPKIDRENPNPSLRGRPLIGLSILLDMKSAGDSQWKGAIYNPDDGNVYSATVKLQGNAMKVQGCVVGVLCKTNTFLRVN
ncbi:MAG: DUF2147 domain-containing protein [Rhizobiales bacterium]|nr:DUF2147 domain-containing protein [Hyphomicrobiales bacterium]MBI3672735.1 DUF2147 domain-containing protein [Hyphomicrobiales bacterium]